MKQKLTAIFCVLTCIASAQRPGDADDYIARISKATQFDTVYYNDYAGTKKDIIGYVLNDTIVKAEITDPENGRKSLVYYRDIDSLLHNVCYVLETDLVTGKVYFEVTKWNDTILWQRKPKRIDPRCSGDSDCMLRYYDFKPDLESKRSDDLAGGSYSFTGSLVSVVSLPSFCGNIAFAASYKFRIIETDLKTDDEYLIVIITCPRDKETGYSRETGKPFFETNSIYKGIVATKSGVDFGYSLYNEYARESLPQFWARDIQKVIK